MRIASSTAALLALLSIVSSAAAFNGDRVSEGPLTLAIDTIPTVTDYAPQSVRVVLANAADTPLSVEVELKDLVDQWRTVGPTRRQVNVDAKAKTSVTFQIAGAAGLYSALYPVHVYATFSFQGVPVAAHAVAIFATDFKSLTAAKLSDEQPLLAVPQFGALALAAVKTQRVCWQYFGQPLVRLPVGWQGTDSQSAANFHRAPVDRGQLRAAIQMHPPYRPKPGTVFAEYRLQLPATRPIRLTFFNAIRDSAPNEPKSDGVTFRVWANEEKLFERHTDAKRWTPGEADLSRFAGREILLRLESHPGPKHNTTCDSSFWGDPVVAAGNPPKLLTTDERRELAARALAAAASGKASGSDLFVFELPPDGRAALALGPHGLADGALAFASGGHVLAIDGLRVTILDQPLGDWPSGVVGQGCHTARDAQGRLTVVEQCVCGGQSFDLTTTAWSEGPGLRIKVACPQRITDVAPGATDQKASRVYYGHAYCIRDPKAFHASGGGHNLATSHVGFDFAGGLSLLMACDNPPDALKVDPDARLYALHAHCDTQFTFVPGSRGALDCAVRYRPLYDKRPAGGVARKAGRFVFDIWGGRYSDDAAKLRRMFDYGLTDALYLKHVWQRWGYDYRLPDIWPPDPKLGTLDELRAVGQLCGRYDVPWGLHDNYVDFYPDADGYSYEHISFDADGQPRKAWINNGRDAQSYSWRPDHFQPFLVRNLALLKAGLHPTASFVDVFTSSNGFDYYDRQGNFHSKLETRRCWGAAFDTIRDTLGGNAPTSSEAGGDHLIGHLDGADCQLLHISATAAEFNNRLPCADWDCVPWYDAVNHARFILHGVGYSGRYEGGRSREEHGIESDDYISAELLTGHALMIDAAAFGRGAVRKYWLAQDFIRSIALDDVASVELIQGDLHRQRIAWQRGGQVSVNRGAADWNIGGRLLPQYGYAAQNRDRSIQSSIERIDGVIVEQSRRPGAFYVNARGFDPNPRLQIQPAAERLEYLGQDKFKLIVRWDAQQPAPKNLTFFVHFFKPQTSRLHKDGFYGTTARPSPPTSAWQGTVRTGQSSTITIPPDLRAGTYDVLVGLYDPSGKGHRYRLQGDEDSELRYRIGRLTVHRTKGAVTGVDLDTSDVRPAPPTRLNVARRPIDFGPATTAGAFRCEVQSKQLLVTPLPDGDAFSLALHLGKIYGRPVAVRGVEAIDAQGTVIRSVEYQIEGGRLSFKTRPEEFAYRVAAP
jgi:hypothetical protein